MITPYEHGSIRWLDVAHPDDDDIRALIETYGVPPATAEELRHPSRAAQFTEANGALFCILHFPAFRHSNSTQTHQEIDCVITEEMVVTVRYDTVDPIHKFSKLFEVSSELEEGLPDTSTELAISLLSKCYGAIEHELDYIRDRLSEIEDSIFSGRERDMVFELSYVSREMLHFQASLQSHTETLTAFVNTIEQRHGSTLGERARTLTRRHARLREAVHHQYTLLEALRSTNDSLLSTKQNEVMKVLTIMAFVTFPSTLLANVFSMNTSVTPLVGLPGDFWLIIGLMGFLTAAFIAFFVYKRWL